MVEAMLASMVMTSHHFTTQTIHVEAGVINKVKVEFP